jgi:hypothetical protein
MKEMRFSAEEGPWEISSRPKGKKRARSEEAEAEEVEDDEVEDGEVEDEEIGGEIEE